MAKKLSEDLEERRGPKYITDDQDVVYDVVALRNGQASVQDIVTEEYTTIPVGDLDSGKWRLLNV